MISSIRSPQLLKYFYPRSHWRCWLDQKVLFSFDDGPGKNTEAILDLGKKYNMKFIFFVLPDLLNKNKNVLKRMIAEGHLLGSHFFEHRYYLFDGYNSFIDSLNKSVEIIENLCSYKIEYCRVPYGKLFPWHEKWITDCNYRHVHWSVNSKDYLHEGKNIVINRIKRNVKSKDIILLHDGEKAHPDIVDILEECLSSMDSYIKQT